MEQILYQLWTHGARKVGKGRNLALLLTIDIGKRFFYTSVSFLKKAIPYKLIATHRTTLNHQKEKAT